MTTPTKWLSRRQQAERYGVTVRCIVRWNDAPGLGLPSETQISGRWYRNEAELEAWEKSRVVISAGERAARRKDARRAAAPP